MDTATATILPPGARTCPVDNSGYAANSRARMEQLIQRIESLDGIEAKFSGRCPVPILDALLFGRRIAKAYRAGAPIAEGEAAEAGYAIIKALLSGRN